VPQRIIFDTDIGTDIDDAYALTFLAKSPEVKIEAVTTVWADTKLRGRIARKLLNLLGKPDIPVAAGANTPMDDNRPAFLFGHEGKNVFKENEDLPLSDIPPGELIEGLLKKYPNEIKVLLMGQHTNLGIMLAEKPELASLIKEFVIMGGVPFYGPEDMERIGERPLEINIAGDPLAASIVFNCGVPITLVGANVTLLPLLKQEHIKAIGARTTPATDLLHTMTTEWLRLMGLDETPMHDPIASAAAFTLDYLDTIQVNVAIETTGKLTQGFTIVNRYDNEEWNRVRVATGVRAEEFIEFMLERMLA